MIDFPLCADNTSFHKTGLLRLRVAAGRTEGVSMKRDLIVAALPRSNNKSVTKSSGKSAESLSEMAWRLERLEGQLQKLSELVREHAEDVDRLVRIVAEDRDVIRRQLLRKHHEKVRVRKHLREAGSKIGLDS